MTDEGPAGDPMDVIEALNAMANAAMIVHGLYTSLISEGFTETQAMKLTAAFLHGQAGGKLEGA